MASRFMASAVLASGITVALFWVMTALIAIEGVLVDVTPLPTVEIVKVIREQPPPPEPERRPIRPETIEPPRSPAPPTTGDGKGIRFGPRDRTLVDPIDDDARKGIILAPVDGDAVPLVRITPSYPQRALARGVEGRVLVEFTIGRSGAVEDARVIAAEPPNVFERAALEAVRQWRYTPKIVDGHAVAQPGIRVSIPFVREGREQR